MNRMTVARAAMYVSKPRLFYRIGTGTLNYGR
jgi:hypothetical protein